MNRTLQPLFTAIAVIVFCWPLCLHAQGTAFNYQGQLYDGSAVANGNYDFRFWIYDSTNSPGVIIAGPITNSAVGVTNGLFNSQLDFGTGVFNGPDRWLQIAVRTNGALTFTNLTPRQKITPVPYAIFANSASNLVGLLSAAQLSGTLPATAFAGYTNTVALTNTANVFAGSFAGILNGNGAGVTNVNVVNLTGILADSQLPTNTVYVNSNQTFTASNSFTGPNNFSGTNFFGGSNTFTNFGNNFSGSFFGNGLVGWIATNGAAVQAEIDHGYVLTNPQVSTLVLPTSASAGDIVRVSGPGANGWKVAQNAGQSIMGNFFNYGQIWSQSSAASQSWNCIASSSDGTRMTATVLSGDIYVSRDSGQTWSATSAGGISPASWIAVACSSDGSKEVALVYGGGIYSSTNYGSTWSGNTGVSSANLYCVATSADGSKSVAAVYGGSIYTNAGTAWAAVGGTSALNWSSLASSDDGSKLVGVVNGGSIYISSNSGKTWSIVSGTGGKAWQSVTSSSDGSKLAAAINNASSGGIYISTNTGVNWSQSAAPAKTWISISSSSDGNRLVAVSASGSIYTSGNGGTTWQQQTNGVPAANWSGIASSADGSKLAATINGGGIYTSQSSLTTTSTTTGTGGYITGGQGSAVELQCIGNNQWMPVTSTGTIWAY